MNEQPAQPGLFGHEEMDDLDQDMDFISHEKLHNPERPEAYGSIGGSAGKSVRAAHEHAPETFVGQQGHASSTQWEDFIAREAEFEHLATEMQSLVGARDSSSWQEELEQKVNMLSHKQAIRDEAQRRHEQLRAQLNASLTFSSTGGNPSPRAEPRGGK
mmetsp:Transcript_6288/g.15298  ORF Transcript_6288/g.15298 Transcript_6288/m.15298 type:complete len:159 (-) Transcript_6288:228-704(-)